MNATCGTYHAGKVMGRSMHTKCLMYHRIEIREIVRKLIISWVNPEFEEFRSQFGLDIRILGKFN